MMYRASPMMFRTCALGSISAKAAFPQSVLTRGWIQGWRGATNRFVTTPMSSTCKDGGVCDVAKSGVGQSVEHDHGLRLGNRGLIAEGS
jgi:hypothetical protein